MLMAGRRISPLRDVDMKDVAGALAVGGQPATSHRLRRPERACRVLPRKPRLQQTSQPAINPPARVRHRPATKRPRGLCGTARPRPLRGGKLALGVCGTAVRRSAR